MGGVENEIEAESAGLADSTGSPNKSYVSGRVDTRNLDTSNEHWGVALAREVIRAFPDETTYTCAAGISPSGTVHFGNFRDVITSLAVSIGLKRLGKDVRLLFSWDDFDRFRKVPSDLPSDLLQHIGKPLAHVPSPAPGFESYAAYFERPFEESMNDLGIDIVWRSQTTEYSSGRYLEGIQTALRKRLEIADVLLANMSDKAKGEKGIRPDEFRQGYFPISLYSEFSGTDNTKILDYDGESNVTYKCLDTDRVSVVDLAQKPIAKLPWKIDWPMRWNAERVNFEPGGRDHASPGGSFDSSGVISELVYNRRPPVFVGYDFIGLQGLDGKMSGSRGGAITPGEILKVYEPEILLWLYLRKAPHLSFNLAFDSDVYRVYDEYDREGAKAALGELSPADRMALEFSQNGKLVPEKRLTFRQVAGFGQVVQWNAEKLAAIASASGSTESRSELESRLMRARDWIALYRPEEFISLRADPHLDYWRTLESSQKLNIEKLVAALTDQPNATLQELETLVYGIPKDLSLTQPDNAKRQRAFFSAVYTLLLGKDTGPRLATFLWAADREQIVHLLTPERTEGAG